MTGLMTQADFARHRGVSKGSVSNWKKAGFLVFREGEDGRVYVDVARTEAKLNAKIDPMRGRPPGGVQAPTSELPLGEAPAPTPAASTEDTLQSERLADIREGRFGKALKNAQLAGELGAIVELEQRASTLGRMARERVHAWFRGEVERFAAEREARVIMAIGEEGIDRVFAGLADQAQAGEFADEEDPEVEAALEAEMVAAIAEDDGTAA